MSFAAAPPSTFEPSAGETELVAPSWPRRRALLTAEWRHLVMVSYEVDPRVLQPLVPAGTEIDLYHGVAYASVVGFLFRRTRLMGLHIPLHANFEEVNLRFYVRREVAGEIRRGVAFVREFAPRRAVAFVANAIYREKYITVPMSHHLTGDGRFECPPTELEYRWRFAGRVHRLAMCAAGEARLPERGSHHEFIAEHYWGYTARAHGASEYQVAHPPWRICPAASVEFAGDVGAIYGPVFAPFLRGEPASAFWSEGSAVHVYRGKRIAVG